jgi:hypothetical protein
MSESDTRALLSGLCDRVGCQAAPAYLWNFQLMTGEPRGWLGGQVGGQAICPVWELPVSLSTHNQSSLRFPHPALRYSGAGRYPLP